jgi:serine/threonine protein kinase/lipopolysaccharide biosynthesis regulator YciM
LEGGLTTLIGQELGGYRIISQVGKGGMATVYKAFQPSLDRYVAVKVMPPFYAEQDETFLKRFRREARSVAKLRHPNILMVIDYGEFEEFTYIVMEYVDAGTLTDRLGSPMQLHDIASIIEQVAGALDYGHGQGVVHRDVKPSNILLPKPNWPLLTDFGLAKIVGGSQLTITGSIAGTPAYMSPEQGQGESVDSRSDIYSLGIVLYEMATGGVPFHAETPMAVVVKHIIDPLPLPTSKNPNLPEAVERVILKALAKIPGDRYQKVTDLSNDLNACLTGVDPVPLPPETVVEESIATEPAPASFEIPRSFEEPEDEILAEPIAEGISTGPPIVERPDPIQEQIRPSGATSRPLPKWLIPAGIAVAMLCIVGFGALGVIGLLSNTDTPPTETPPTSIVPTVTASQHVIAGRDYVDQGLSSLAIEEFEAAVSLGSKDVDMYFELADLYLDEDRYDNAISILNLASDVAPNESWVQETIGWYFLDLGFHDEAIFKFEHALDLDPQAEWILEGLAEAYRGVGNFEKADEILGVEIETELGDTYYYENLGWDYLYSDDYSSAEAAFMQAIELDQNNTSAWDGLSDVYWYSGSPDVALAALEEALLSNPDYAWFYTKSGWIQLEKGNYEQAQVAFEQSIQVDPVWSSGYSGLSDLYGELGDYASAVAVLEEAIELNPQRSDLFSDLGWAYLDNEQFDSAIAAFEEVINQDPTYGWYYYDLAIAFELAGRWDEAAGTLEEAGTYAFDDAWLYEAIGWEFINMNMCDVAVSYFEVALELDSSISSARDGIQECGG